MKAVRRTPPGAEPCVRVTAAPAPSEAPAERSSGALQTVSLLAGF